MPLKSRKLVVKLPVIPLIRLNGGGAARQGIVFGDFAIKSCFFYHFVFIKEYLFLAKVLNRAWFRVKCLKQSFSKVSMHESHTENTVPNEKIKISLTRILVGFMLHLYENAWSEYNFFIANMN